MIPCAYLDLDPFLLLESLKLVHQDPFRHDGSSCETVLSPEIETGVLTVE